MRVPPDQSDTPAASRSSVERIRPGESQGVRRVNDVLKAKTSVRRDTRLSARMNASTNRTWASIEPLVSHSTTRRGSSIARWRRASGSISPSVATVRRKVRRMSGTPPLLAGVRRLLGRAAQRGIQRSSSRSISARLPAEHSSKGLRLSATSGLYAAASFPAVPASSSCKPTAESARRRAPSAGPAGADAVGSARRQTAASATLQSRSNTAANIARSRARIFNATSRARRTSSLSATSTSVSALTASTSSPTPIGTPRLRSAVVNRARCTIASSDITVSPRRRSRPPPAHRSLCGRDPRCRDDP